MHQDKVKIRQDIRFGRPVLQLNRIREVGCWISSLGEEMMRMWE